MNAVTNKLQEVKKFRYKLRQTLAMKKMTFLDMQPLFKEATTAFVQKCCQKQHRNKVLACALIN